jgi:hypothetical protein
MIYEAIKTKFYGSISYHLLLKWNNIRTIMVSDIILRYLNFNVFFTGGIGFKM